MLFRAENAAVEFNVETLRPTFRLDIGQFGMSNALSIARRLKLPRDLLRRAQRYLRRRQRRAPEMSQLQQMRADAEKAREEALPAQPSGERQGEEYRRKMDLLRREAEEAAELRERFRKSFWVESDGGQLAFLLDGQKKPVRTVVSKPGHCLWLGILDAERGRIAGRRLLQPDLFTGWGLRVLSDKHPSYDPHSYQRGSVWPHDTVIAAAGLRRYGLIEEAWTLLDGLLSAVMCFEDIQMPELFSGLPRKEFAVPVPYRMANVPQAWSAGCVMQMVRVLLGVEPDLSAGRLYVDPALPPWCPTFELNNSRIGPREVLEPLGIPVRIELPGVGRNLQDRYEVGVVHRIKKYVGINEDGSGHALPHASGTGQCPEEKAYVPAPFASPAHSRLARPCVPSAGPPVAGKH